MIIFLYTFAIVFIALVVILGLGSLLTSGEEPVKPSEGKSTAAMCTTRLLGEYESEGYISDDDFVIEQNLVYTYDSLNL